MLVKLLLVDINKINIDEIISSSFISPKDLLELSKYKIKETYNEKLVSRYLKNKYIGEYQINENGKPIANNVYFNISHSHGLVGLVINDQYDIGLDIEKMRDIDDSLKKHICSDEEYQYSEDNISFLQIWTNKESLLKCLGTGINKRLKEVIGLPINGIREYMGEIYRSNTLRYKDYIITVTIKGDTPLNIDIIEL